MLIKNIEIQKFNLNNCILLFYGINNGLKKDRIYFIKTHYKIEETINYDEQEILLNKQIIFDQIYNKSFFNNKKILIINASTDKIVNVIEEIKSIQLEDIIIIFNSNALDNRSKLRKLFEKESNLYCVPFYPDDIKTLTKLASDFLKEKKINISYSDLNLIIERCRYNRMSLLNELEKIYLYSFTNKINSKNISKITNLSENYEISELIDFCLNKNNKKIINVLNENNFSSEESITIIKLFINKLKKLLNLRYKFEQNKNLEKTINEAKPPIFWKEKKMISEQIKIYKTTDIKKLIFSLQELEFLTKKNINNSMNIVSDFILTQFQLKSNN